MDPRVAARIPAPRKAKTIALVIVVRQIRRPFAFGFIGRPSCIAIEVDRGTRPSKLAPGQRGRQGQRAKIRTDRAVDMGLLDAAQHHHLPDTIALECVDELVELPDPDPDIALIASDICFQQGVASTVLFNDAERAASESAYLFRLRTERVDYVRRLCDGRALQILPDRKMRNSLIHIDEHLAKALRKPNTGWFIDTAIGWRDQFVAERPGTEIAFCRTYISSEDSILHLGNQISLAKLRDESAFVLAAVFGQAVS